MNWPHAGTKDLFFVTKPPLIFIMVKRYHLFMWTNSLMSLRTLRYSGGSTIG